MTYRHQTPRSGATRKITAKSKSGWMKPSINLGPKVWLFSLVMVGVVFTASLLSFGFDRLRWPISSVSFDQLLIYQNLDEFKTELDKQIGKNLMRESLKEVKQDLESLPWIASAELSVLWPGVLRVEVIEERPVAVWNDQQIISQTGKLFVADNSEFKLPYLYGDEDRIEMVMSHYLNFNRSLIGFGQVVEQLTLSRGGSWTLETESGFRIQLGSSDVLARFQRALTFLDNVQANLDLLDYIDARYNNGIAYKLKQNDGETSA